MPRTYAFLDTNTLLQFRSFHEIDWPEELSIDEVELVIAKVLFTELDKHKDGSNPRLRDGSRRVGAQLEDLAERWLVDEAPILVRPGVWLSFRLEHPRQLLQNTPALNEQQRDDVLVAAALAFRAEFPERAILLVSDDRGPRITARSFGLSVFRPPEHLRLPDQRNPQEQELARLRQENQRLRDARPKLDVRFADLEPGEPFRVRLEPGDALSSEALSKAIDQERQSRIIDDSPMGLSLRTVRYMSDDQVARYNSSVEAYLERYAAYLQARHAYQEGRKRSFVFQLELWNTGVAAADDVDVKLHFPDGFTIRHVEKDEPPGPKPPAAPALPRAPWELTNDLLAPNLSASILRSLNLPPPLIPSTPPFDPGQLRIRKSKSYDASATMRRIKAGTVFQFNPLRVQFDSDERVSSFAIQYSVHALLLTEPDERELNVIVTR